MVNWADAVVVIRVPVVSTAQSEMQEYEIPLANFSVMLEWAREQADNHLELQRSRSTFGDSRDWDA